jgi:hypothetical protein
MMKLVSRKGETTITLDKLERDRVAYAVEIFEQLEKHGDGDLAIHAGKAIEHIHESLTALARQGEPAVQVPY